MSFSRLTLGFALAYNARNVSDVRSELGARFDHLTTLNDGLTWRAAASPGRTTG